MPESMMVCFSVAGIYYFPQWLDEDKLIFSSLAIGCCALAILMKIPTLYIGFPLLYLAYNKYKFRLFQKPKLWLFGFLVLLPGILWCSHIYQLGIKNISTFYNLMQPGILCNFNIFHSDNFYGLMASRFATIILTPQKFPNLYYP